MLVKNLQQVHFNVTQSHIQEARSCLLAWTGEALPQALLLHLWQSPYPSRRGQRWDAIWVQPKDMEYIAAEGPVSIEVK
jgi:hypothetical protein